MKICDIVQFYSPLSGGVKRYVHDKGRYLAAHDVDHVAIVPGDRDEIRDDGEGTRVRRIRSLPLPGSRSYRMLLSASRIDAAVAEEAPDLIEVGDAWRAAWVGAAIARRRGIPVVAYYHSDLPRALPRRRRGPGVPGRTVDAYLRRLYGRMDAVVTATDRLADALEALGLSRPHVIPLGVDGDRFRPPGTRAQTRAALGFTEDDRVLLFAGRMAREKRVPALAAALDRIDPALRCRLVLIGDGELRRTIGALDENRPDVTWLRHVDSSDRMSALYEAADLFVHPGAGETFGLVCGEAMACGTRVIAVRGGGAEHWVEGEDPPALADSPAPDDLAAAVTAAAEALPSAQALSGNGSDRRARRRRVLARYSADRTFAAMLALYRDLCHNPPATATDGRGDPGRGMHGTQIRG